MRLTHVLYLVAALATPALAQPPASKAIPDVVVVGKRDHQDAAHRFVNEVTVEREGQVAQFGEPICPLVLGLVPPAYNAGVRDRMLRDAQIARVRIANGPCEPNVIVMITDDGTKLLEKLRATHREFFEGLGFRDVRALLSEPGPVHVWQGVEFLTKDGFPVGRLDPDGPGSIAGLVVAKNYSPSRLTVPFRWRIDTAFMVIDVKSVSGLTLTQVADYAAMRTLAITRDPKGGSLGEDSILTLFDGPSSTRPPSLSTFDIAYLQSLYSSTNELSGSAQRSNIAFKINQSLSAPAPASP